MGLWSENARWRVCSGGSDWQGMLDAPSIPASTLDNDRHKTHISNRIRKTGEINGKRGEKHIANKLQ